jgi:hypothetical protein
MTTNGARPKRHPVHGNLVQDIVDDLAAQHAETQNPLCAWSAFLWCSGYGLPFPPFVLRYLRDVAKKLLLIPVTGDRSERMAAALDALRFRRRGRGRKPDAFEGFAQRDLEIAVAIEMYRSHDGLKHAAARSKVIEELGVSQSTVDRAWSRWRSRVSIPGTPVWSQKTP